MKIDDSLFLIYLNSFDVCLGTAPVLEVVRCPERGLEPRLLILDLLPLQPMISSASFSLPESPSLLSEAWSSSSRGALSPWGSWGGAWSSERSWFTWGERGGVWWSSWMGGAWSSKQEGPRSRGRRFGGAWFRGRRWGGGSWSSIEGVVLSDAGEGVRGTT